MKIYKNQQTTGFFPCSLAQCKSLTQETAPTNCSDTGERAYNKENSLAAAEYELPAWCMLPKENQLKYAAALTQSPVSQTSSSPPPPLKSSSLFLAIEGGQWHLFDRQKAAADRLLCCQTASSH